MRRGTLSRRPPKCGESTITASRSATIRTIWRRGTTRALPQKAFRKSEGLDEELHSILLPQKGEYLAMSLVPALVPLLRVADLRRSIGFYESLGFTLRSVEGEPDPFWANLCASGDTAAAELMLSLESGPIQPSGVVLYYYVTDVRGLRERLIAGGMHASMLTFPGYAKAGEFTVTDPDGHVVLIGQPDDC